MPYGEPTHGWWCNARTYRTRCKYCGEEVFYFTCDCGCKVFFDELGWPWPEHLCWQYLAARYGKEFAERAMSVQMMIRGRSAAHQQIDPEYAHAVRQRHEAPKPPTHCIVRCDPAEGQTICDVGIAREVIPQVDVFEKLCVRDDSAIGIQILGPLGHGRFGQLTIHTGDLAREDANSYTCFVTQELLRESGVIRDDVVAFELLALVIPGLRIIWLCEELDFPFA